MSIVNFFLHSTPEPPGPFSILPSSCPLLHNHCCFGRSSLFFSLLSGSFILNIDNSWHSRRDVQICYCLVDNLSLYFFHWLIVIRIVTLLWWCFFLREIKNIFLLVLWPWSFPALFHSLFFYNFVVAIVATEAISIISSHYLSFVLERKHVVAWKLMAYDIWIGKVEMSLLALGALRFRLWGWLAQIGCALVCWRLEIFQMHLFFNPASELAKLLRSVFGVFAGLWSFLSSLVVYLGLNRSCFPCFLLKRLRLPLGDLIPLLFEMQLKLVHSPVLHLPLLLLLSLLFQLLLLSLQLLLSQDRLSVHHRLSCFICKSFLALLLLPPFTRYSIRISEVNQVLI